MTSTVSRVSALVVLFLVAPLWVSAQIIFIPDRCPVVIVPGLAASHNSNLILHDEDGGTWDFAPTVDWFDSLIERLESEGYALNQDLFIAFYDWRQSNQQSAEQYLKPVIDQALSLSLTADKVCLVTHSMGGLVARAYIQSDDLYGDDVEKLVFLGTPNQGAAGAYLAWEGGRLPPHWNFLARQWINRIERTLKKERDVDLERPLLLRTLFPSLKELLPTSPFLNRAGTQLALESHKEQNDFLLELNQATNVFFEKGISVTAIAGNSYSTIDQIPIVHDRSIEDLELSRWRDGQPSPNPPQTDSTAGDQTVLFQSALSIGSSVSLLPNTTHEELPGAAQSQIISALGVPPPHFFFVHQHLASAAIGVDILSPLMPKITGPNGEVLSSTENTFPKAVFDWDPANPDRPKMLTITDPPAGTYTVTTIGTGSGEYTIITSYADTDEETMVEHNDVTEEGQVYEYTFVVQNAAFTPPDGHTPLGEQSTADNGDQDSGESSGGGSGGHGGDCCPGPDPAPVVEQSGRVAGITIQPPACEVLPAINASFERVFGRHPTDTEYDFWAYRLKRGDKQSKEALVGALQWFKDRGSSYDALLVQTPAIVSRCSNDSLVPSINQLFRKAFGRGPSLAEHAYWLERVEKGEKITAEGLLGAMQWQAYHGE